MRKINLRFAGILAALLIVTATTSYAADKIVWKPIPDAILQIDSRAPKLWNLFQAGKKFDPLMLQLGSRYLVIFVRNKEIYEINPEHLEHKGEDLLWRESDKPTKPIATSDWSTKGHWISDAHFGKTCRRRTHCRYSNSSGSGHAAWNLLDIL